MKKVSFSLVKGLVNFKFGADSTSEIVVSGKVKIRIKKADNKKIQPIGKIIVLKRVNNRPNVYEVRANAKEPAPLVKPKLISTPLLMCSNVKELMNGCMDKINETTAIKSNASIAGAPVERSKETRRAIDKMVRITKLHFNVNFSNLSTAAPKVGCKITDKILEMARISPMF